MAKAWTCKYVIDQLATRLWDTSTANKNRIRDWINEIILDLVTDVQIPHYNFKMKRLLPTQSNIVCILPEEPSSAPSIALGESQTTYNYNSSNSGSFTFTAADIEFTSTLARLKGSLDTNETFRAIYENGASDVDAYLSAGSTSGSSTVTNKVENGQLNIENGVASYDPTSCINPTVGAIRFKYIPKTTGNPGSNQYLFEYTEDGTSNNRMYLYHLSNGNLAITVSNSSGSNTINLVNFGTISPVAGTAMEIEINWDFSANELRCFVDGTQLGSTITTAVTRDNDLTSIDHLQFGENSNDDDFYLDDIQIFSAVQHTANFTSEVPRVVGLYTSEAKSIEVTTGVSVGELSSFTATVSEPTNTQVKFYLDVDGTDKYWDGSAWSNSNGSLSQANTAAEINTNAAALLSGTAATIKVVALLQSSSATERPSITSVIIGDEGIAATTTDYKATTTFLYWDEEQKDYVESMESPESSELSIDFDTQIMSITGIPTLTEVSTIKPNIIHRRVYLAKKTSSDTEFQDPVLATTLTDNTTTTASISSDPTSVITPPSEHEMDQRGSTSPRLENSGRWLQKNTKGSVNRYDPNGSTGTPDVFDDYGLETLFIYPALPSTASNADRTLTYDIVRRPHEAHYTSDQDLDIPMSARKALFEGVIWKGYEFRDRDRTEQKLNNYLIFKKEWQNKVRRQLTRPGSVRDIEGNTWGFEVN